jgi:hypothetical protein
MTTVNARRSRWATTRRGSSLSSQRQDFARALQSETEASRKSNDGRCTVYAYLRDRDSSSGKAGSPYYVGVASTVQRPYAPHGRTPVPSDERRIRLLRGHLTRKQAREWEKFYIAKFGRRDNRTGRQMLINQTDGGEGVRGPKVSASTRIKLSKATKGMAKSAEHRAKIGAANKGKQKSAENCAKLSAARKGKPLSAEHRAKLSAAHKGKGHSAEAKAKMSKSQKGLAKSVEHRFKLSKANKGKTHSEEARAKMKAAWQVRKARAEQSLRAA